MSLGQQLMHLAAEHSVQSTVYRTLVRRGSLSKYVLLINPVFFITTSSRSTNGTNSLFSCAEGVEGVKGVLISFVVFCEQNCTKNNQDEERLSL